MQLRVETKRRGVVIVQVFCEASISDGDLVTMLEDAEQDLRWNIMKDTETHHIKPEGGADVTDQT